VDTIEEWRQIEAFPDYEVSQSGGVRRAFAFKEWKAGRPLKFKIVDGYNTVALYRNKKASHQRVNRLVAQAFIGEPPTPRHMALHGDGNRQNNHYKNLRWGLHRDNLEDMKKHGTEFYISGEAHHGARLTAEIVREARRLREAGGTYASISETLGFPVATLCDAVRKVTWRAVS
jgi:HNH endonuclease